MVSWRRGNRDSALHYWGDRDGSRTLCGVKIPPDLAILDPGDGLQCENCAIMRARGTEQKSAAERRAERISKIKRQRAKAQQQPPAHPACKSYPAYLDPSDYWAYDQSQAMARGV